ncbi:hypothetical protein BJ165DRAFT_1487018, partial [Panaeolus papilionaceus]
MRMFCLFLVYVDTESRELMLGERPPPHCPSNLLSSNCAHQAPGEDPRRCMCMTSCTSTGNCVGLES